MSTTDVVTVASDLDEVSSLPSSELDHAGEHSDPGAQRHERFYFDDGSIVIQAEGKTYRLHHFFLHRDSRYFARLFPTCPIHGEPIKLVDTPSADFDVLLSLLYPRDLRRPEVTTVEGWMSVLRVATKFEFNGFRELAIEKLEPTVSPVDMITLSHELDIPRWLQPGYVMLCMRTEPLGMAEASRLRMQDVVLVFTVHGKVHALGRRFSQEEVLRLVVEAMPPVSTPRSATPLPTLSSLPGLADTAIDMSAQSTSPTTHSTPSPRGEYQRPFFSMSPVEVVEGKGVQALFEALTDENFDVVSDRVVEWANLPPDQRSKGSLGGLVWSILAQGAREPTFIRPGCRLISKLIEKIGSDASDDELEIWRYVHYHDFTRSDWEYTRRSGSMSRMRGQCLVRIYLQKGVEAILHRPRTIDGLDINPYKDIRCGAILAASGIEYQTLCLNATHFVAELLKEDLIPFATAFDGLRAFSQEDSESLKTIRDILLILGPILDVPVGEDPGMNAFLATLKSSIGIFPQVHCHSAIPQRASKKHRPSAISQRVPEPREPGSSWRVRCILQDIFDLREKHWVA